VYVDGAARGNPGPAAAGISVYAPDGRPVRRIGRPLGTLPNNQAEYYALLLALDAVPAPRPATVLVRMDSELVVRQLSGQYRVKHPVLQELHGRVRAAAARLGAVCFEHVPRGRNAEADRLANLALDGAPTDEAL
jgi:ribonuclease HI